MSLSSDRSRGLSREERKFRQQLQMFAQLDEKEKKEKVRLTRLMKNRTLKGNKKLKVAHRRPKQAGGSLKSDQERSDVKVRGKVGRPPKNSRNGVSGGGKLKKLNGVSRTSGSGKKERREAINTHLNKRHDLRGAGSLTEYLEGYIGKGVQEARVREEKKREELQERRMKEALEMSSREMKAPADAFEAGLIELCMQLDGMDLNQGLDQVYSSVHK